MTMPRCGSGEAARSEFAHNHSIRILCLTTENLVNFAGVLALSLLLAAACRAVHCLVRVVVVHSTEILRAPRRPVPGRLKELDIVQARHQGGTTGRRKMRCVVCAGQNLPFATAT